MKLVHYDKVSKLVERRKHFENIADAEHGFQLGALGCPNAYQFHNKRPSIEESLNMGDMAFVKDVRELAKKYIAIIDEELKRLGVVV